MEPDEIKARQRAMYGLGDYSWLSRMFEPAAAALVAAARVTAETRVLDVGCGDGNVAFAARRAGAAVVGCDLTPEQLELAEKRALAIGVRGIEWVEADVEALPFADETFDAALSAFGVVYAPDPTLAAQELFRVVRAGGVVGFTAWPRDSLQGRISQTLTKYLPAPAPAHEPEEWGDEQVVRRRLAPFADEIRVERHRLFMEAATREELWQGASEKVPAQRALARALAPEEFATWRDDWMRLCGEFDRSGGRGDVRVEAEYLLALARRNP